VPEPKLYAVLKDASGWYRAMPRERMTPEFLGQVPDLEVAAADTYGEASAVADQLNQVAEVHDA
jgi:hypothetical protein